MKSNVININRSKIGKCYELSLQYILANPNWKLIHGYISNQQPPNQTIDHAWCINGDKIHDEIFEKDFHTDLYTALFAPKIVKKYKFNEMIEKMNEFETYGPWHDVDEFNEDYYDEYGDLRDEYKRKK